VHTFGEPMSFWERNMPTGMLLRSGWAASHIADRTSLDSGGIPSSEQQSLFQPRTARLLCRLWTLVSTSGDTRPRSTEDCPRRVRCKGFRLILEEGETVLARRLVVAAGIGSFTWRPPEFAGLPCSLASHTVEHRELRRFAGKQVLVIGSGQSALESAALLHESGAEVEIVARARQIHWLGGVVSKTIQFGLGPTISKLLYAPTDVGPAGISQIVARPDLVRRLPRSIQDWLRNDRSGHLERDG